MIDEVALAPRVSALEGLLERINLDLSETRMLAASANLNAVTARSAVRSVKGNLEDSRALLLDLVGRMDSARAGERNRLEFVVSRIDRALQTIALDG